MSFLRKIAASDGKVIDNAPALDRELLASCPALHEYLVSGAYDDGTSRQTSTVTIFAEDGAFKACLNERESGATLWATGVSVNDAFGGLEALLEGERPPWRMSRKRVADEKRGRGRQG